MNRSNIKDTIVRLDRRMLEVAYPDDIVKSLGGVYPDTEIDTPSRDDGQRCIDDYYQDVSRRAQHDAQYPNEPKQIKPGEDVRVENGRIQISGGQTTVMNINGLLTKVIFDRNPLHEFYEEESFPLEWMYPHLTPFGVIMKINREEVPEITQAIIDKDHAFWSEFSQRTIGNWINYDTSIPQICQWAEDVYLRHNFANFTGDRKFVRDDDAQKAFSKMRSSIGASIYKWRMENSRNPAEIARVTKETEFALKQAFAYCPYSPEVIFHLMNLLLRQNRVDDAIAILKTCHSLDPYNGQISDWVNQLQRSKGDQAGQIGQIFAQVQHALETGNTNMAKQGLDMLLHGPVRDPNIMVGVAAAYLRIGDMADSEQAFLELIDMTPGSAEPWYNLALVQNSRGETAKAVASLKKAFELNPAEIKANPKAIDLHDHFLKDATMTGLRQSPEFKAAFPEGK